MTKVVIRKLKINHDSAYFFYKNKYGNMVIE